MLSFLSVQVAGRELYWHLLAALFGALVGISELLSRYRDEPFRTLPRRYGIAYTFVNALTSLAACLLVSAWKDRIFPQLDSLGTAMVSGFGAMAVLRSKFLTFRTKSEEDVPIGLDAVVRALLSAIDRGVDRDQSESRWRSAYEALSDVATEQALDTLFATLRTNLGSYQNVSSDELQAFDTTTSSLKQEGAIPMGLRAVSAGLAFQAIAGSSNFERVTQQFRKSVQLPDLPKRSWWNRT